MGGGGGGGYVGHILSTVTNLHERQSNIYLMQMTRYHSCGTPYLNKVFSLNACATGQLYITSLVWTCSIFAVKQIIQVTITKT